jgi:glycosyltransferase involved in cell wall biosynthesis
MAKNLPLNILIVCEHASNVFGGEAMLPLNYFRLLSKTEHKPYLITHARVRSTIQQIEDIDQDAVFYLPDTKLHIFLHRYSNIFPERIRVVTFGFLMHLITQFYQWRVARQVIKAKGIDIVHEPAPVSATQPSAMFALGVPVIIGPMNGGMSFPKAFDYMSGRFEKMVYKLIPVFSAVYNLLIPGKFFADILLVANQRTANSLPQFKTGELVELVENGTFSVKEAPNASDKTEGLSVIYVGRLVDWKTVDIVIDAVAKTKTKAQLRVVGDGDDRGKLEAYVTSKNLTNIEFVGMVPHTEVNKYYDEADIFVLPSVRECGGAVVLEAMSRGLPVIATNWGGPADYISEGAGFLVEPLSRDYMVNEFARIIDQLSQDPNLRLKVGAAAIERIKANFMWNDKVNTVIGYYKKLTNKINN